MNICLAKVKLAYYTIVIIFYIIYIIYSSALIFCKSKKNKKHAVLKFVCKKVKLIPTATI